MTAESASQEGSEPTDAASPALAPGDDGQYELKDKFRQALERKRGMQTKAAALAAHTDASKARGAHGPTAGRRSFRRKSGG
ncbi:DUF5302 domain-containing protein [Streptomyces sp. CA-106110]|uniref:DUF5302 domain-containing protein n=1 Tax=Streptomyces sp. CA-106110 TaxID=3240044 RepID=UPI003D8B4A34